MYYPGVKAILEASDIAEVHAAGPAQTLPDGRQALPVLLVIDPERGKHYADGEAPAQFHVTNGVSHRLLPIQPAAAAAVASEAEADDVEADAEVAPEAEPEEEAATEDETEESEQESPAEDEELAGDE